MTSTSSLPAETAQLFQAVATGSFDPRWYEKLNGLQDVDVRNTEGWTLLQEAVMSGRLGWVEALVKLGADPETSRGLGAASALEVGRQMAAQYPENAERRGILKLLHVLTTWRAVRKYGGRVDDPRGGEPKHMTPKENAGLEEGRSEAADGSETLSSISPGILSFMKTLSEFEKNLSSWRDILGTSEISVTLLNERMRSFMGSLKQVSDEVREKLNDVSDSKPAAEAVNHELPAIDATDLSSLQELLGVKYEPGERKLILPCDKWNHLIETVDGNRTTLLMKAARYGSRDCVDFLLRCGSDVNACRDHHDSSDERLRAIDFAVDGDHREIVYILLQWDSLLPDHNVSRRIREKFSSMVSEDENIGAFFRKRDEFHKMLEEGDLVAVEDILRENKDGLGRPNYWVDSRGRTSLYTAACKLKYDCLALLMSMKFDYHEEEAKKMTSICPKGDLEFDRALGRYFQEVKDSCVYKMLSRTRVRGNTEGARRIIQEMYEEAIKVPEAKLLLQYLQDDTHFEVIFEVEKNDINCMCSGYSSAVRGVMDPKLDRVYVSVFSENLSDNVSNLVHELAHKVMHAIFQNDGLPYRRHDRDLKQAYDQIEKDIMTPNIFLNCNNIIKRVRDYPEEDHPKELIVRVPEILTKDKLENGSIKENLGKNEHEEKLFQFYFEHVQPEINSRIEKKGKGNRMPICDIMAYPTLLSDHKKDQFEVDDIENSKIYKHNGSGFFQVSSLKLGLSHLGRSLKNLVCVDWKKFIESRLYFETGLSRGYFDNMAIVWDKGMGNGFCENSEECEESCPAFGFVKHQKYVTFVIPKTFRIPQGNQTYEYGWKHLAKKTQDWVLGRKVDFQGRKATTLGDMIGDLVGSELNNVMDADSISWLIEEGAAKFGRDIESDLKKRGQKLLRDHPKSFIPRTMRLRPVKLRGKSLGRRIWDAVFICNATEGDLTESGLRGVLMWDGKNTPTGQRHFLVKEDLHGEGGDELREKICDELRNSPDSGGKWQFAHFFRHEDKNFFHIHSRRINEERCQVLADAPGSGKSVLVNSKARDEKKKRWVDVIELTEHEREIQQWKEKLSKSEEDLEEFLYLLISKRDSNTPAKKTFALEKNLFKRYCQADNKVILYFDGFDEICPDFKESFSIFLERLLQWTKVTFFVTTRTHECADLERRISTLAYNLVPFDEDEQVKFINLEWNFMLKSMEKSQRGVKIKSIISRVKTLSYWGYEDEIRVMINDLEEILKKNPDHYDGDINFKIAAKILIDKLKDLRNEKGYLFEIPLHTWMLASVGFKSNLFFADSLSLPLLYKDFTDVKIDVYSTDKAKDLQLVAGDCREMCIKTHMWSLLKKFSAYFFLPDRTCAPTDDDVRHMLRVGLVVKKENSNTFIHRTFGEYLFSIWLLEEAQDIAVAQVILSQVLLEDQYKTVRKFIDGHLISLCCGENMRYKINLPNDDAFPDQEMVNSIRKCLYTSIIERNEGILRNLVEISGRHLGDVLFGEAEDFSDKFAEIGSKISHLKFRNAFTLCGGCAQINERELISNFKSLQLLQTLLRFTENYGLTERLRGFVSEEGLWWTGAFSESLWNEDEGRAQFRSIFEFLLENKEALGETLKEKIMAEECERFFANASVKSFGLLQQVLESILTQRDFETLLVPPSADRSNTRSMNFVSAWTNVVIEGTADEVENVWNYLGSKLTSQNKRQEFLRRKDNGGRNALLAAFDNSDRLVITFVWKLMREGFSENRLKGIIFETFEGTEHRFTGRYHSSSFVGWLRVVIREEFLTLDEVGDLLLSKDTKGNPYLLKYKDYYHPSGLFDLQELFSTELESDMVTEPVTELEIELEAELRAEREYWERAANKLILDNIEGHFAWLAPSCFLMLFWSDGTVLPSIRRDFEEIRPILLAHLPEDDIPVGEDGIIGGVTGIFKKGIKGDSLMGYAVILWRQLKLEKRYFTTAALTVRIKKEWVEMSDRFPLFHVTKNGGGVRETKSFLIPYFFAILSEFLSEEQLREVLLHGIDGGTSAFHSALVDVRGRNCDPLAFLALYDVARKYLREDALWTVHSIWIGGRITLLNILLKRQREECF